METGDPPQTQEAVNISVSGLQSMVAACVDESVAPPRVLGEITLY